MPVYMLLFALIAVKFSSTVKKRFPMILGFSIVLAFVMYLSKSMTMPVNSGELGMALFLLVMYQSAFKKGSKLYQKLLLVRKEYSILGFVFIIPHALLYMFGDLQTLEWNGILSFLIMIPLFITSFIFIRKKMTPKHWKTLHLASYPAYALMFAHVLYVGLFTSQVMYLAIAVVYLILKIKNTQFSKLNKPLKLIGLGFVVLLSAWNLYTYNLSHTYSNFEELSMTDGVYTGEASGFKGKKVKVNVTISENEVTDIAILDHGATEANDGMDFKQAVETLKDIIIDEQSTDVDVISGATRSTTGLKKAVDNAVNDAGLGE